MPQGIFFVSLYMLKKRGKVAEPCPDANKTKTHLYTQKNFVKMSCGKLLEKLSKLLKTNDLKKSCKSKKLGVMFSSSPPLADEERNVSINLGMKDARLRIRGDKAHPLGLCLNCSQPATNRELTSCSEKVCVKECKKVFYWVRKVIKSLDSSVTNGYVNYQMGQGGL